MNIRPNAGALAAVGVLLWAEATLAAPPTLSHLYPAGGQRGAKIEVACTGSFKPWPVSVWAPGIDVAVKKESGKLEISIPADLAADRVWIRLYNAEGASAAIPFLIGNLKEINDQEPNNSHRDAQTVADPNVTINGALKRADVDGFAVDLTAGQTLVADLDAYNDLGSPMDAILQVASANGFVLAQNHDEVDLDPRLAFTATHSGTHIVRVFAFPSKPDSTIAFRGGSNYIYRLTITTGPFITHAIPLSVSQADPGEVELAGWNLPPGAKLPVVPFGGSRLADSPEFETLADLRNTADARLGFVFAPNMAGGARVRLTPHAIMPALAPSTTSDPLLLTVPTAVTGRLQARDQTDVYRLPLKKGQQVVIAAESRSVESALQPTLQLTDPAGKTAAKFDNPAPTQAAIITHIAKTDGDYQITVRDLFRQCGEHSFYRLTVRPEEPDFELSAAAAALVVAPNKPTELVVNVKRRAPPGEKVGPITIEAVDMPPGVTAPAVISQTSGGTSGKVTLKFTTTGPAFSGRIRITGVATQPQEIKRLARTPPRFGACFDSLWLTSIAKP